MYFPRVFHAERNKIDYLKASYKTFLHESGKEAVVTHVRLFKTYAPSRWKQTLLAHYTQCRYCCSTGMLTALEASAKSNRVHIVQDYTITQISEYLRP
jgi:hypothetical protein